MIIFIKKIKTKEGINFFDVEKIKKDIPAGYRLAAQEPTFTLTANHMLIACKCEKTAKAAPEAKPKKSVKKKKSTPATS